MLHLVDVIVIAAVVFLDAAFVTVFVVAALVVFFVAVDVVSIDYVV